MEKPQPEKHISAELRLEIRDEVEKRLTHLPGETLKIIQGEVASRVADTERFYVRLAFALACVVGVVFGVTWNNLREQTQNIIRRTGEVEILHSNVLVRFTEITNLYAQAFERYIELTNRIHELEGMDNIVTAKQLQKAFDQVGALKMEADGVLFTATAAAAAAGDANAFDRLQAWKNDASNPLSGEAGRAIEDIFQSMTGPFWKPYESKSRTTWDLNSGFENAKGIYMKSLPESRLSVIETIGTATNFSIGDRLNFLVEAAQTDSTIVGRRKAVDLLNEQTTNKFTVRMPDLIADWWRTNKANYTSK